MRLETEKTHSRLYKAHWSIMAAADHIHAVIVELNAAGRYEEDRTKLALSLAELAKARDLLDTAMRVAGSGRTALIRATGCDGSCSTSDHVNDDDGNGRDVPPPDPEHSDER